MSDLTHTLQQQVQEAFQHQTPLRITGGGSRPFLPQAVASTTLDCGGHQGILAYHPEELVITVRGGTTLEEINQRLKQQGQRLAFDPPQFSADSTIAGTVATAAAGPSRPWSGGVRDHLLGVKLLNGEGRILHFGGEVVKNVAGYDLFRPMAGAYGTLGVLLELSLKTLPLESAHRYWQLECSHTDALTMMQQLNRLTLPCSGLSWYDNTLHLRLSGQAAELDHYTNRLQEIGLSLEATSSFWQPLRDQQLPLFDHEPLWRLSLPADTPTPTPLQGLEPSQQLIDWGGSQRWIAGDLPVETLRESITASGGHAMLFRGALDGTPRFHPLTASLQPLQQRLKQLMDPAQILNSGLMEQ